MFLNKKKLKWIDKCSGNGKTESFNLNKTRKTHFKPFNVVYRSFFTGYRNNFELKNNIHRS